MDITIIINTDNAAFGDHEASKDCKDYDRGIEVSRILSVLAERWSDGIDDTVIHDINGNNVGHAIIR